MCSTWNRRCEEQRDDYNKRLSNESPNALNITIRSSATFSLVPSIIIAP